MTPKPGRVRVVDPNITVTLPGSVLADIHHVARRTRELMEASGDDEAAWLPLRNACMTIESALRSNGFRPQPDGNWRMS